MFSTNKQQPSLSTVSVVCGMTLLLSLCQPNRATTTVLTEDAAISNLVAGLYVNEDIIKELLPQPLQLPDSTQTDKQMKQFYDLLHSLTLIGERENTLTTMSSSQDSAEMMAIQTVVQKLTDNACDLLKLKVGDQTDCSYAYLKELKTMIETLHTVTDKAVPAIFAYHTDAIEGVFRRTWIENNVVCDLTTSALGALNSLNRYRRRPFSQDNC